MKKLQPVGNYVLIDLSEEEKEEKTAGGIIIPDTAKEKPQSGLVVGTAVDVSDQIAVGDTVIYKNYSGTEITHENKKYLLVPDSDILAKIVTVDEI